MNRKEQKAALACAIGAAKVAGELMRQNLYSPKAVNEEHHHDIKLELDVRCQELIERTCHDWFPGIPTLGEEGVHGDPNSDLRWVVDPIDGTVNYAYGVPHACAIIALQERRAKCQVTGVEGSARAADYETLVGVVYDPFCGELWTALRGQPARMNGRAIHVSRRAKLSEAVVTMGFSKSKMNLQRSLPYLAWLSRRARKVRIMGSAGLALAYVAMGRFDAYVEREINLWDIAAGGLMVECAGGKFSFEPTRRGQKFRLMASNGRLHGQLRSLK